MGTIDKKNTIHIASERIRLLNNPTAASKGPVVYWMSRDQRLHDNWALLRAQQIAKEQKQPLAIVFILQKSFLSATLRQYDFMLRGLAEVQREAVKYGIGFEILFGEPKDVLPVFIKKYKVAHLVTDFSPLRVGRQWREAVAKALFIPFEEVDAHNIIPAWYASPKQEFAAYTIRPKIHRLLGQYLTEFPKVVKQSAKWYHSRATFNAEELLKKLDINTTVPPVKWITAGESAAKHALQRFLAKKIDLYDRDRNNPIINDAQSNLSPYLHFGQIAAQRIALEVKQVKPSESQESFLEELIVRRELSDNFCLYNKYYDSFKGFPEWAQRTLNDHREDSRPVLYTRNQLEKSKTHDDLWNACQTQMVDTGKMHGWMRMYWAKKILEWTVSPEQAMEWAIYLNDTYELDGRDPNGYVGIAWSIGGVHDRAWGERSIFGKIRYMSYNGAKSKFKIKEYIAQQSAQKKLL